MKKAINLDFTSLLDVIMILLFIILAGIGQKAQETKEDLVRSEQEVESLNQDIVSYNETIAELQSQNKELTAQLDNTLQQYNDLLAITREDKDTVKMYSAAIRRTTKYSLICTPVRDGHSGSWNVDIDLYTDNTYGSDLTYTDSFRLTHDYELSAEERQHVLARQELDLTHFLEKQLPGNSTEFCYIQIEYPANDQYFSSLDLDIINKSLSNMQNGHGLQCYVEKIARH